MRSLLAVFKTDTVIIPSPLGLVKIFTRRATMVSIGQPVIPSPYDLYAGIALRVCKHMEDVQRSQAEFQRTLELAVERYGLIETQRRYSGAAKYSR